MTVRLWRVGVAALAALCAALFFVTAHVFEGVTVLVVTTLWFVDRARVSEALGAEFLHHKAYLEFAKIMALAVAVFATFAAIILGLLLDWNHDPEGPILFAALAGLMYLLAREAERRLVTFENLMDGGNAEVLVSNELRRLPEGFEAEDNWLRPDGYGNVDHIVRRPDGEFFAIETKSGHFRHEAARQALWGALAVKKSRDLRWVTPVVCATKSTEPPRTVRDRNSDVWVVALADLAKWLPTARPTRRY
jgi:hypothetical protein